MASVALSPELPGRPVEQVRPLQLTSLVLQPASSGLIPGLSGMVFSFRSS